MKKWLSENWDKLALGVLATIVAGIAGFFSALADVRERLASVETEMKCAVTPKLETFDENDDRIRAAETEILFLKERYESARQTDRPAKQRKGPSGLPLSRSPSLLQPKKNVP